MSDKNTMLSREHRVYGDIRDAIGETPLIRLNRVSSLSPCPIFAKVEFFNPGGSVKDRIAVKILDEFERTGQIQPGGTIVEATSGNTGVGLAIAAALRGYQAVFVMPDKMSQEKIELLRAFGARVVITPTAVEPTDPRSYYSVAKRVASETHNAILANQYHNPINPETHFRTTAPEIWDQTQGKVTHIVVGMGTGGTITGIGRYMQENNFPVKIIGVDPEGSLLADAWRQGGSTEGLDVRDYKVEGIGEDFIPSTLDLSVVDEVVQVSDAESFQMTRRLVREEGIFCGGSSGSAMAGALNIAPGLSPDDMVVVILPDSGSRYLSKVFNNEWMREHGFLEYSMSLVSAGEVARSRSSQELVTAGVDDSVLSVIKRMREKAVSQLPVIDDDDTLLGIVTEVSLLDATLHSDPDDISVKTIQELIQTDVSTAEFDTPLQDLLPTLLQEKVIILVDPEQQPSGILTVIDALEHLATTNAM